MLNLCSLLPDLQPFVPRQPGPCSVCPVSSHFWRLRNPQKPGGFHQFAYFTFFPYQKELVPIQNDGYSQDGIFLDFFFLCSVLATMNRIC